MDTITGDMTFYNHANSGLPDNDVRALAIEDSAKWIGTDGGGLAKLDGTNWTVYNTTNSGVPDNDVRALAIEGSTKWIGTLGGGLASYNEQGIEEKSNIKNQSASGGAKLEILKNPFIRSTVISYETPVASKVSLKLYDITGSCVKTLVDGQKSAGSYTFNLNAKELLSGVYFAKFSVGKCKETKKLILMK